MIRLEHTVTIPCPVDKVFAYAADYRRWPEWFVGVSDVKPTTSTERGNGARYSYKVRMMSVAARVETEIHDFEQGSGWTGVGVKGVPHRTRWKFAAMEAGTRFTYELEGRLPVPLVGKFLDGLLRPEWDRIIVRSLENLRQRFLRQPDGGTQSGAVAH